VACIEQLQQRTQKEDDCISSRIQVLGTEPLFFLTICRQCIEAPCVDACITGALRQAVIGVMLNDITCIGCGMCTMACPFGAIWLNKDREKSVKCDGCPNHAIPPCINACRPEALQLEQKARIAGTHRRRSSEKMITIERRVDGPETSSYMTHGGNG